MIEICFFLSLFLLVKDIGAAPENSSSRFGFYLPEDCGTTRYTDAAVRIIGGDKARLGEFPWMARLGFFYEEWDVKLFFCGGSLINKYYVLSAAHCSERPINIVRLGENYVETEKDCDSTGVCAPPYQDINVKKIMEPDYCIIDKTNDILLVELEEPATFNDFVKPVCLPNTVIHPSEIQDHHVLISGWGLIQSTPQVFAEYLMYITAPVTDKEKCNKLFSTYLVDSQLCIGYDKGKDSCDGDSGGPVVKMIQRNGKRRAHLLAVVSYGLTQCGDGPAVYTYIPAFLHWIDEFINKD